MTSRISSHALHKWHREFNASVFGGELDKPVLTFGNLGDSTWGICHGQRIVLAERLRYIQNECRATLLHEMVHQWQHERGLDMDHSSTYTQWRSRCFDITGLHID